MRKDALVAKEKKYGLKKKRTVFNFNKTKKPPSFPNEHTTASTKTCSNKLEQLEHTDF